MRITPHRKTPHSFAGHSSLGFGYSFVNILVQHIEHFIKAHSQNQLHRWLRQNIYSTRMIHRGHI